MTARLIQQAQQHHSISTAESLFYLNKIETLKRKTCRGNNSVALSGELAAIRNRLTHSEAEDLPPKDAYDWPPKGANGCPLQGPITSGTEEQVGAPLYGYSEAEWKAHGLDPYKDTRVPPQKPKLIEIPLPNSQSKQLEKSRPSGSKIDQVKSL